MAKNVVLTCKDGEVEQLLNSAENSADNYSVLGIERAADGARWVVVFRSETAANPESDSDFFDNFRGND